jgi:hypothetical protein
MKACGGSKLEGHLSLLHFLYASVSTLCVVRSRLFISQTSLLHRSDYAVFG